MLSLAVLDSVIKVSMALSKIKRNVERLVGGDFCQFSEKQYEIFLDFLSIHYAFGHIRANAIKLCMVHPSVLRKIKTRLAEAYEEIGGGFLQLWKTA